MRNLLQWCREHTLVQQSARMQHASRGAIEKRIVSAGHRKNSTDSAGGVQLGVIRRECHQVPV